MADDRADSSSGESVEYPTFDHGEDLYVLNPTADSVEFSTGRPGQYLRSHVVLDPADYR